MINISSKYLVILILLVTIYVAFKKDKNIETLDCLISLNDLERNMYRQEVYKKLKNIGLTEDQMLVLYNDLFEKTKRIYDYDMTLERYLISEKLNGNIKIIQTINEILNERRLSNPHYDYIIDGNTLISDIKNTVITRDMKNRLICGLKNVQMIENFIDNLNNFLFSFRNIPCNAPRFVEWCNTKLKNKDPDAKFALSRIPISIVLNGFDSRKIGGDYLVSLIDNLKSKGNINFSSDNYKHVIALLKLLIIDLKAEIKKYKSIPKENKDERIKIIRSLKYKINIFYELKAHYKLVRIYSFIDTNIKTSNSDFKEKALSCCGNFEYPYKCYNFENKKSRSSNGIFGFDKYGFVKESGCSGETLKDEYDLENVTVISFFDKDENFSKMDENKKSRFYSEVKSFFLANNVRLSGQIENKVLNRIKDKVGDKKDDLAAIFGKEITSKPNGAKERYNFNPNDSNLIKLKEDILTKEKTDIIQIQKNLEKKFNFTPEEHYINPDLVLDNNKDIVDQYIHNFSVMLDLAYYAENVLNIPKESVINFVMECFGLKNSTQKYSLLFAKKVPLRFQNIVMAEIEKIIRNSKGITISENKFDIDDIISDLIKSENLLPDKREIYSCKKYNIVLKDLRDQKMISYFDLKNFKKSMNSQCLENLPKSAE
jgi:hypothetical protein